MEKRMRGLIAGKITIGDEEHAWLIDDGKEIFIPESELNSTIEHDPISNLIGVEVDYLVTHESNEKVFGSRKQAMEKIQEQYKDLKSGDELDLFVIKIKEKFIIGTAAGREILVPASNVSTAWIDLEEFISVNQKYKTYVTKVNYSNEVNPLELKLTQDIIGGQIDLSPYEKGAQYLAEIKSSTSSGFIANLTVDNKVNVMCRTVNWRRQPMKGDKVVVVINRVVNNKIFGYIKRMF